RRNDTVDLRGDIRTRSQRLTIVPLVVRIHQLPEHRKSTGPEQRTCQFAIRGTPVAAGEDTSHSTEPNDGVLMNTTYHDRNHSRLGDIVDGITLTKVHYLALLLVVTGGLFEVMEQHILASLGPSLQEAFGASAQDITLLSTATLLAIAVG